MTGTVFNVYLGGTGENLSENQYELSTALTRVLKSSKQREYVDYVFYDGVDTQGDHHRYPVTPVSPVLGKKGELLLGEGSDNILNSVCGLIAGTVEPSRLVGMVTEERRHLQPETPYNLRALNPAGVASLKSNLALKQELTSAEQEKVNSLIDAIRAKNIAQVNLIGWSRGGYNAIRIAHQLNIMYPRVRVNILAFDPVPGPLNHTPDTLTLTPNVKNYVSLIALNEYRLGFIPVIPVAQDPHKTHCVIKTIPGNHSVMMKDRNSDSAVSDISAPVANRALSFALKTLNEWGAAPEVEHPKLDSVLDSDWAVVGRNRNVYQEMVAHSSVSNEMQVLNYKSVTSNTEELRYRLVHHARLGYRYLSDMAELQHNPPDVFAQWYGMVADTCTLHRDYNDRTIASRIQAIVSHIESSKNSTLEFQEKLYEIQFALEVRHQTRGRDHVLLGALEYVERLAQAYDSIFFAASAGDISKIQKYPLFINNTIGKGDTPLMIAARKGNETFVQELMKYRVDFSLKNTAGETALDVAAKYGKIGVLNLLRKHYSMAEQINALMTAAKNNQRLSIQQLTANINYSEPCLLCHADMRFLLMWTVENNDMNLLSSLLKNSHMLINLPLNAQNQTILGYAKSLRRNEMVATIPTYNKNDAYTSKPLVTTSHSRLYAGMAMTAVAAYPATVLGVTLMSMTSTVGYSKLTETLFLATSLQAPVPLVAIILTSMLVIAGCYAGTTQCMAPRLKA